MPAIYAQKKLSSLKTDLLPDEMSIKQNSYGNGSLDKNRTGSVSLRFFLRFLSVESLVV